MNSQRKEVIGPHSLGILGISEAEERVYRWLLGHPGATAAEIASGLKLSSAKVQRLIETIALQGLTTHSPERPRRFFPASPGVALKALSLRRQEELQYADRVIQILQERSEDLNHGKHGQVVELVTSHEAVRLVHRQLLQSARREVVALSRPPMLVTEYALPQEREQSWQRKAQAKGVRFRTIVDSALLELPNAVHFIQADIESGDETRLTPSLPIKMVLVDQSAALIPLNLEQTDTASLLIRSSALLNLLYGVFENLWARSAPISFPVPDRMEIGEPDSEETRTFDTLLKLMAAGANDKKIVSELKISESTLTRDIAKLKRKYDARTRFQLGWVINQHLNNK